MSGLQNVTRLGWISVRRVWLKLLSFELIFCIFILSRQTVSQPLPRHPAAMAKSMWIKAPTHLRYRGTLTQMEKQLLGWIWCTKRAVPQTSSLPEKLETNSKSRQQLVILEELPLQQRKPPLLYGTLLKATKEHLNARFTSHQYLTPG